MSLASMGLRVVAKFSNLIEAEVAGSALRAAGVQADIFDRHIATALWDRSRALGGIRLMVPDEDFSDARAILSESITSAAAARLSDIGEAEPAAADGSAWRWAAAALGVFVSPALGWLIVAGRRQPSDSPARFGLAIVWGLVLFSLFLWICGWLGS